MVMALPDVRNERVGENVWITERVLWNVTLRGTVTRKKIARHCHTDSNCMRRTLDTSPVARTAIGAM